MCFGSTRSGCELRRLHSDNTLCYIVLSYLSVTAGGIPSCTYHMYLLIVFVATEEGT